MISIWRQYDIPMNLFFLWIDDSAVIWVFYCYYLFIFFYSFFFASIWIRCFSIIAIEMIGLNAISQRQPDNKRSCWRKRNKKQQNQTKIKWLNHWCVTLMDSKNFRDQSASKMYDFILIYNTSFIFFLLQFFFCSFYFAR